MGGEKETYEVGSDHASRGRQQGQYIAEHYLREFNGVAPHNGVLASVDLQCQGITKG